MARWALLVLSVAVGTLSGCGTDATLPGGVVLGTDADTATLPADSSQVDDLGAHDALMSDLQGSELQDSVAIPGCTLPVDCLIAHSTCEGGTCIAPKLCQSDVQCKGDNFVCNKNKGICVQCVTSDDCQAAESCDLGKCQPKASQACLSSKTCPADQVCDQAGSGLCVQCVTSADCDTGTVCSAGHNCVEAVCTPFTTTCTWDTVRTCAANGLSFTEVPCPQGCGPDGCPGFVPDPDAGGNSDTAEPWNGVPLEAVPLQLNATPTVCTDKCPTEAATCGPKTTCGVPCGPYCILDKGEVCSEGTCAVCKPTCTPGTCGSNGCGGVCACNPGQQCDNGTCTATCSCEGADCGLYSFEEPISYWSITGSGAISTGLANIVPPHGTNMLWLSNGWGAGTTTSAKRSVCVPSWAKSVRVAWRVLSEEWKEYCGSQYVDNWSVRLENSEATATLVSHNVADMCPDSTKVVSGFGGLKSSSVDLDQGEAFDTGWVQSTVPLAKLQGKNAVVTLQVNDIGDSIYDTVLFVDAIQFLP